MHDSKSARSGIVVNNLKLNYNNKRIDMMNNNSNKKIHKTLVVNTTNETR